MKGMNTTGRELRQGRRALMGELSESLFSCERLELRRMGDGLSPGNTWGRGERSGMYPVSLGI